MVAMTWRDITWRDIKATNEIRCRKLLEKSELLVTDDLAWDQVPKCAIADDDLYSLIYMRDVEGFTSRGFAGLSEHPATWRDPLVARFLRLWHAEETEHARALARFPRRVRSRAREPRSRSCSPLLLPSRRPRSGGRSP